MAWRLLSFWEGPFSGAMLVLRRVYICILYILPFLLLVFSCCFGWISSSRWNSQCKPFQASCSRPSWVSEGRNVAWFYQPNGLFLYENWCKSKAWFLQLKIVIKNSILPSLFWRIKLRPLKRLWEAKNRMSPFPPSMGSLSRGSLGQCISEIQNVQLRSWKWRFEDLSWI